MGGTITLESELGVGTSVTVVLPLAAGVSQRDARLASHKTLNNVRILVVDDRAINREIITSYLQGAGAIVQSADSAATGLRELSRAVESGKPFSTAVVDMLMPGTDGLEFAKRVREYEQYSQLSMIMVTSLSWKGDARSARALGFSEFLTKPVRRRELLDVMTRVLMPVPVGQQALEANPAEAPLPKFNARVLVAEDNLVNQEVILEYLSSLGCTVTMADNGKIAVDHFKAAQFDLVVMDCQMPEMDGLTATRQIRAFEATRPDARTPIIAVTANAFAEDRAACLQAGMDDYMSKPFTEDHLVAMLTQRIGSKIVSSETLVKQAAAEAEKVQIMTALDEKIVRGYKDKRPQLWARLISTYLTHAPKTMADIVAARDLAQVAALRMATHSLKSSSANVGALRLAEIAREIEALATTETIDDAIRTVDALITEYAAVEMALRQEHDTIRQDQKIA
jgi:CheY-like chemotaxis protein